MTYYKSAFCTANDVIKQFALTDAAASNVSATTQATLSNLKTGQLTLLKQLIFDASDEIIQDWQRTFVPFQATYTVYPSMQAWTNWRYERGILRYYLQDLEYADLLSLTSVNQDGTALSSGYYRVESNEAITFDIANVNISAVSGFSSYMAFTGIWGYHENYSVAWASVGTLLGNLNDSATSFTVTTGTVETYQYIKLDTEFLFVTNVTVGATDTITVERGGRGTTAAAHTAGATLYAYQQMPDVILATRRRVINLMQKRAELANLVQIGETTAEASTEKISLKIPVRYVAVKSV